MRNSGFGMDVHRNNCFSLVAVETAFREGGEWLEQLLDYLEGNIDYTWDYLKKIYRNSFS